MNNLNKIDGGSYSDYNQPEQDEALIDKALPPEVLQKVLASLDSVDMQHATLVSWRWSYNTLDVAKREEFAKIKRFAQFLGENLKGEGYAPQREKLSDVFSDREILTSVNLLQTKELVNKYKEIILNLMKDLPDDELGNLEKKSQNEVKPILFENIFELAPIYKQIAKAELLPQGPARDEAIEDIMTELAKKGSIAKVLEIATTISDAFKKEHAISSLMSRLAHSGVREKAVEFANALSDTVQRQNALVAIYKAMSSRSTIDELLAFANTVADRSAKDRMLDDISRTLASRGEVPRAIEVASTINDESLKEEALNAVAVISRYPKV